MEKRLIEEQLKEVNNILSSISAEDVKNLSSEEYAEAMDILRHMEDLIFNPKRETGEK